MIDLDALVKEPAFLTKGQTYREILESARRLLNTEKRWTQGYFARDAGGLSVKPKDPDACCWCLLGAVARCSGELGMTPPPLLNFLRGMVGHIYGDQFMDDLGNYHVGEMNDYVSHEQILEFLDRCIQRFDE